MDFITKTVEDTIKLGNQIGTYVNPGDILCINGDLGTGKTHLVKGIAEGLGIAESITSPTFNIVNEYYGRLKLYHFDVYRVNDPDEIAALGFDEYIFDNAVSVIEWANFIMELIPKEHIEINIEKLPDSDQNWRRISINCIGDRYNYIKGINI
jgi:tRNA threonylcarbamoyladenosine biosynthesis protein TsaE